MFRAMTRSLIPEGMVRFTHALVEDVALRSWFLGLEHLSASLRQAAFSQMAQQMRSDRDDLELAAAASALARPEVYDAVLKAVRERCELQ
jgi:hypothetical protein